MADTGQLILDETLRDAVKEKLGLDTNDTLTTEHLLRLEDLFSDDTPIESLEGLQHAVNLNFLHISNAQISDLTPLKGTHVRGEQYYGR